jgi:hypothetical protein
MENSSPNPDPAPPGISRRTVAKGAAWAVPVIVAATATPAHATSQPDTGSLTITSEGSTFVPGGSSHINIALTHSDGTPWSGTVLISASTGIALEENTVFVSGSSRLRFGVAESAALGAHWITAQLFQDGTTTLSATVDLTVIATPQVISAGTVTLPHGPNGLAYDVRRNRLYIAYNASPGFIGILDPATLTLSGDTVNTVTVPTDLYYDESSDLLYGATTGGGYIFNPRTGTTTRFTSHSTAESNSLLSVDPASGHIYLAGNLGNLRIVDPVTLKVVATISLGTSAAGKVAFDSANRAYAPGYSGGTTFSVHVIDRTTLTTTQTFTAPGSSPKDALVVSARNQLLVAANPTTRFDLDTGAVVDQEVRPGGQAAFGSAAMAYDSAGNQVFITDLTSKTVRTLRLSAGLGYLVSTNQFSSAYANRIAISTTSQYAFVGTFSGRGLEVFKTV